MKDLLFLELIIFVELLFTPRKYSESSENSGKILRDIMEHEEPK